jgi:hypothetical protein
MTAIVNQVTNNLSLRRRYSAVPIGLAALLSALVFVHSLFAVELTEPEGAAHGYPAWLDINGKKLADGEFRQWIEDKRLHIAITYEFKDGRRFEEKSLLRQEPELIQEQWSWKELNEDQVSREFTANFLTKTATAQLREKSETKHWSEKIEVEPGRTFAGFGFSLALANLRKRLVGGEKIELKAVGFAPKPQIVTVAISHGGLNEIRMAGRTLKGDQFVIHPEIPFLAKLFVQVPDTKIWLANPPPAGFLRWEGPIAIPGDPLGRVDLVSGEESGRAQTIAASKR